MKTHPFEGRYKGLGFLRRGRHQIRYAAEFKGRERLPILR